jgi:hypothetical protein
MALEQATGTGIALNVTRTRITVLVFNLTIISVMLSILNATHGSTGEHVSTAHLTSFVALFIGFCLTILGVYWLLHSQNWDAQGLSHPRPFTFGAMTTYLALSQTITAFMHEYLLWFKSIESGTTEGVLTFVPTVILDKPIFLMLLVMGGSIWILTTYIAPLLAAIKGSALGEQLWIFVGYYCAVQIPIYWVYARAWHLQYVSTEQPMNMLSLIGLQFIQPLLWFR